LAHTSLRISDRNPKRLLRSRRRLCQVTEDQPPFGRVWMTTHRWRLVRLISLPSDRAWVQLMSDESYFARAYRQISLKRSWKESIDLTSR